MDETLVGTSRVFERINIRGLLNGLGWGLVGGLTGTVIMDLVLMGVFSAFGLPAMTCFSIIGNTIEKFFLTQSLGFIDTNQIGIVTHYIVGPVMGVLFGTAMARWRIRRVVTPKKVIFLAILWVEILSQPLLLITPILLKMTMTETLEWYGGAFVMHLIAAVVMGLVVYYCVPLRSDVHHK